MYRLFFLYKMLMLLTWSLEKRCLILSVQESYYLRTTWVFSERCKSDLHLAFISHPSRHTTQSVSKYFARWFSNELVVVATAMASARSRGMCANYMQTSCEGENERLACARDLRPANRPRLIQQHLTVSAVSSDVAYRYSLLYCYYYYYACV